MNFSRKTRWAATVVVTVTSAAMALGCSNQLNDQGGVQQAKADYILTYLNVDNFPNVTMLCIHGAGFATTTRDYDSLTRVPEWDTFCATKQTASPAIVPAG